MTNACGHILFVEDDEATRYSVARVLAAAGYRVSGAEDGETGLRLARTARPDLILLDVQLPDLSGFDVARQLRDDPRTAELPIVHLSAARITTEERVRGLEGGADAYLTHPVEPPVLVATIHALLRARRAEARSRESETRFRLLWENLTAGAALHEIVRDEGGAPVDCLFVEVNAAFERQVGQPREAIVGRRAAEVLGGRGAAAAPATLARFAEVAETGRSLTFEQPGEAAGQWYSVLAYRPAPGQVAAIFTDVTDRKRSEVRVAALNADLARRSAELTASNAELEAFAYSVSHDLRAPLRTIAGFSSMALEDYGDRLDATGRRYLETAVEGARRMAQLIDDLLEMSRVARIEMLHEPVDLAELAATALDELRRAEPARSATVSAEVEPGLRAVGDPTLLRLVMTNLVRNAWKFTSRHATARIRVGRGESRGRAAFFVADDGAGFDMAFADKLLRPFQRLHSGDEFPGTGIGLATVNRIVRRHGGEVWAEGAVEQGATVWFTLPAPQ